MYFISGDMWELDVAGKNKKNIFSWYVMGSNGMPL